MSVKKNEAEIIRNALQNWKSNGFISDSLFQQLSDSLQIESFDWKKLAKFCFFFAAFSFLIALPDFHALIPDWLENGFVVFFRNPQLRCAFAWIGAFIAYALGLNLISPKFVKARKIFLFMGLLSMAWFLLELAALNNINGEQYVFLLLFAACFYGIIGYYGQSPLLWVFALISLGSSLGMKCYHAQGYSIFGIPKTINFMSLGIILSILPLALKSFKSFKIFQKGTLTIGLFYLFMSLWILSIWGTPPCSGEHLELFLWSIIFGSVAILCIYFGLRMSSVIMYRYGLVFFAINLFTRGREYFWDIKLKSIFFFVLGFALLAIAIKIEKFWSTLRKLCEPSGKEQNPL
jgi:hypothetical protein